MDVGTAAMGNTGGTEYRLLYVVPENVSQDNLSSQPVLGATTSSTGARSTCEDVVAPRTTHINLNEEMRLIKRSVGSGVRVSPAESSPGKKS